MQNTASQHVADAHAAEREWKAAAAEADHRAIIRAHRVAIVVEDCGGNQSEAARALGLDQSTVNKLAKKSRARTVTLISANPGDDAPGHELADPDCPEIPGLMDRADVKGFFAEHGYDDMDENELMYLVTGVEAPSGYPHLVVRY